MASKKAFVVTGRNLTRKFEDLTRKSAFAMSVEQQCSVKRHPTRVDVGGHRSGVQKHSYWTMKTRLACLYNQNVN